MKRYWFALFLLLLFPFPVDAAFFDRNDCDEVPSNQRVAEGTFCLQRTTAGGRGAGITYIWNGTSWRQDANIPRVTIATRPTSPKTGDVVVVTDANSSTTCSVGGGTANNSCQWDGSAWVIIGGGGGGGAGTPGGSDTQCQFNDGGSFGGDSGCTYNKTTDTLTVAGNVSVAGQSVCRADGTNCPGAGSFQPADADLTALAANTTAGFWAAATNVPRTLTAGSGISITNPTGTVGNPTFALTAAADCLANSATTQVLFNNAGTCDGIAAVIINAATGVLTATGFSGPVTGNVTSSGQSTFTGTLIIPGKSDPVTPIVSELWRNTEDLKWYTAATIQRALRDTNFAGSAAGIMNRTGAAAYSILPPTDDTILIGNGTIWENKSLGTSCQPSTGQALGWDPGTNSILCATVSTSGLASVTEDADSVNIAKAVEIGVQTNAVNLVRSGTLTGARQATLSIDADYDVAGTTGIKTLNQLLSFDVQGRGVASGTTKWFKAAWDGGMLTTDGTQCADATKQTLDGTPQYTFSCTKNAAAAFYGQVPITRAITTVTFQVTIFHAASEVVTFAGDISAKCRGDGEAMGGSWGTAVTADITTTALANQVQQTLTGSVTPNGSCAAGDILFWRWVEDEPNFSANAANSRVVSVLMLQDS